MKTPLSLPPLVMVTNWTFLVTASSSGATPSYCGVKKSSAPPPVTPASRSRRR
jgi:hypothetical protein